MTKIAVVDIETTGLDPVYDLILEIGIVELDLDTGATAVIFDSLVKELGFGIEHKGSWIFLNTDLKFEDLEDAPFIEDYRQELQDIFDTYRISAYNTSFDLDFLKARGFTFPNELACIMRTSTDICRIPHPSRLGEYKWPKVQEAWDYFFPHTDYTEIHRAADDAKHEAKICFKLYKMDLFPL